jgi:hypothetical protein
LSVSRGGTGLIGGTSGGILGFTGPTTLASSALLAANAPVIGGGAAVTPSTITAGANNQFLAGNTGLAPAFRQAQLASADFANQGTTTTVLHGNAAGNPSFGAVSLTADVTGDLPYSNLAQGSALSVLGVTGNAGADVASIAAGSDHQVLRRSGTALGFGAVDLSQSAAVTNQLGLPNGGTAANLTAANGGVVYSTAAALAINTPGSSGDWLRSAGAAAPAWIAPAALTKTDDTNVTLTLGGSATTALLNAASLTLGWTGQLGLTRGGTAASLVASNGGIVYSGAAALAILSGTATAGQIIRSGASAAPTWSTATYPATAGSAGNVLRSNATNFLSAQLAAADLSNGTTGSGSVVLSASPTLTGTLGAANGAFTGTLTAADNFGIAATKRLYLDGVALTGDTYLTEGAANRIDAVVAGGTVLQLSSTTLTLTNSTNLTVSGGTVNITGLTASQAIFTDGSKNLVSNAITGSGSVVMSTNPTLVTPTLGVATLTSANFGQDPLNYYDEGPWTPANPNVTLTVNSATYTRKGREVAAQFDVTWPATADGNNAQITGLPNAWAVLNNAGVAIMSTNRATYVQALAVGGATRMDLYAGGGILSNANVSGERFIGTAVYFV